MNGPFRILLLVALVLAFAVFIIQFVRDMNACEAGGGVMVRGAFNMECVKR